MNEKSRDSLYGFIGGLVTAAIPIAVSANFGSAGWQFSIIGLVSYLALLHIVICNLVGLWTGRYDVVVRAVFIGCVFAAGFVLTLWTRLVSFGVYLCILSAFHWSEYFVTAVTHEKHATIDSYLLSHSTAYKVAALASWLEYGAEWFMFEDFKVSRAAFYARVVGLVLVAFGELLRKGAMFTAMANFNHYVRHVREDGHVLITHGVYAWFRHPAYVGWFYWSIGTQILLFNPLCLVAYTLTSWKFFQERIRTEELTLINFFGADYVNYQKRVCTGLPFIRGYRVQR